MFDEYHHCSLEDAELTMEDISQLTLPTLPACSELFIHPLELANDNEHLVATDMFNAWVKNCPTLTSITLRNLENEGKEPNWPEFSAALPHNLHKLVIEGCWLTGRDPEVFWTWCASWVDDLTMTIISNIWNADDELEIPPLDDLHPLGQSLRTLCFVDVERRLNQDFHDSLSNVFPDIEQLRLDLIAPIKLEFFTFRRLQCLDFSVPDGEEEAAIASTIELISKKLCPLLADVFQSGSRPRGPDAVKVWEREGAEWFKIDSVREYVRDDIPGTGIGDVYMTSSSPFTEIYGIRCVRVAAGETSM
jgi:hypothetical protein